MNHSGWALVGVVVTLIMSGVGAGVLAMRLPTGPSLAGTALTVITKILGAEIGHAIALYAIDCEGWGGGPGVTVAVFSIPAAVFGYAFGWILRQPDQRGSAG